MDNLLLESLYQSKDLAQAAARRMVSNVKNLKAQKKDTTHAEKCAGTLIDVMEAIDKAYRELTDLGDF